MVSEQLLFFCAFLSLVLKSSSLCNKIPEGIVKPKNRNVAGRYLLEISGDSKTYTPLQRYNISLKSNPRVYPQKTFKNFMITLEPDDIEHEDHALGQLGFEYDTEMLARFSRTCPNTVTESSVVPKTEIEVHWMAPEIGSGCVNIKATVVESKENWFSEDEMLTKRLCEKTLADENIQPDILEECCACDEAKYELAFEGKWTRNTHPRYFPIDHWNTKISDVIGASHEWNHSFWRYQSLATEGLKELAETGETKTLESELKNNSEHIRTIIKARGLQYPNVTKFTYAVFRVDQKNHLVSLVAKIIPSPDWIVGVSSLELCRKDCTWDETRTLNLFPWDVGTDNGIGYKSSDPIEDPLPIRAITHNFPDDPNSPFYDQEGEQMKPIAKLHLTRQRLYTKKCEEIDDNKLDCSRKDWSHWSSCTGTCGEGVKIRQRAFMTKEEASECGLDFTEQKTCFVQQCTSNEESDDREKENSTEDISICNDDDKNCEEDPTCPGTFWGPWSSCSVSCGKGTKKRIRMKKRENDNEENDCAAAEEEEEDCEITEQCNGEEITEMYNGILIDNIITAGPVGKVIDCKVSKWSRWTNCTLTRGICGRGYKYKTREIKVHQANGGKECPKNLFKKQDCVVPCPNSSELEQCLMGEWTNWTPCSSNCGASAVQIRTRPVLYQPPGVKNCPARKQMKQCHLPLACTEDGQPIMNG